MIHSHQTCAICIRNFDGPRSCPNTIVVDLPGGTQNYVNVCDDCASTVRATIKGLQPSTEQRLRMQRSHGPMKLVPASAK